MNHDLILTAAWVAPMTGAPLRDSAVVFRAGRIAAVGPVRAVRAAYPQAKIHDAGNAVVLPGLVNAHTHLELSLAHRGNPPARFVDWIIDLVGHGGTNREADATRAGIRQCLSFGVTCVGDITSQPAIARPELARSPLRGVSYGEVRAMAQRRGFLDSRLEQARTVPAGAVQLGITPHAPYSVEIDGYRQCLAAARADHIPLATHLAETPDEAEFLADQTGPFKELWDFFAGWDEKVPRFAGGPIRFAKAIGLLDYPTLLAHVNYCDDAEMDLLARGRASVVYCPRTHEFFGHRPHRWREMLARGINVAVGTDSCASSPDLNIVDDLRLLHRIAPEAGSLLLWQLVTTNAAQALEMTEIGSLSPGNHADAAVFPVTSEDPLLEIIQQPQLAPAELWVAGQRLEPDTESAEPTG